MHEIDSIGNGSDTLVIERCVANGEDGEHEYEREMEVGRDVVGAELAPNLLGEPPVYTLTELFLDCQSRAKELFSIVQETTYI